MLASCTHPSLIQRCFHFSEGMFISILSTLADYCGSTGCPRYQLPQWWHGIKCQILFSNVNRLNLGLWHQKSIWNSLPLKSRPIHFQANAFKFSQCVFMCLWLQTFLNFALLLLTSWICRGKYFFLELKVCHLHYNKKVLPLI